MSDRVGVGPAGVVGRARLGLGVPGVALQRDEIAVALEPSPVRADQQVEAAS